MFWEERPPINDFMIPGKDCPLPEKKLDLIEYLTHLFNTYRDKTVYTAPYEREYALRKLSLPLSDEKFFEEYPVHDNEDQNENDESFDPDSEENVENQSLPWENDEIEEFKEENLATDQKVPYSFIKSLRYEIKHENNLSKRAVLAIAIARYVIEQYHIIKAEKSRELLNEAKSLFAELISEGDTEYCIHYARLLNEAAFLEFVYPKGDFVSMNAVQESIKYLQEILGSGLADDAEIMEQMNGAWRIQADSFEKNGAINSALASRLHEEDLREKMLQNGDIEQLRELAVVYSAIAANQGALGDYAAALDKFRQADEIWGNHLDEWECAAPERFNITYRIGMTLHRLSRETEAIEFMEERADEEREFVNGKEESFFLVYGNHLQIRADFYLWLEQYERFLDLEKEIILLYEKLAEYAKDHLQSSIGSCLLMLADTYKFCGCALHTSEKNDLAYSVFDLGMNFAWAAEHWFNIDTRPLMIDLGARYAVVLGADKDYQKASELIGLLIALTEQLMGEDPDRVISLYPRLLHHYAHVNTLLEVNDDTSVVLDKCIKYWENIVIEQGKLGWREAYAASLGERGTFYLNTQKKYEKALYDFSKAAAIIQEIVEDDEDYSRLPLYIAVTSDKGNTLDKMGRKSEALPVVLALFDYMTNLYLKKKIRSFFDRYYDLGLMVVRYYFAVNGANRAVEEINRIIDNFRKIRREFLRDSQLDTSEIVDILEYTLFTFQSVKILGLCENSMSEQDYVVEIRDLHHSAAKNILNGNIEYIEKDLMILEKFFSLGSKGAYRNEVFGLLQSLLNDILEAIETNSLEWNIEYESLFKLFAHFCDSMDSSSFPSLSIDEDASFKLQIRFASCGKNLKIPTAFLLYCSCLEDRILYLFNLNRFNHVKMCILKLFRIIDNATNEIGIELLAYKGIANYYWGHLLIKENDGEKAKDALKEAIRILLAIGKYDPDYLKKSLWGANSYYFLASITENNSEAISLMENALAIYLVLFKEMDDKSSFAFNIVNTYYVLGKFRAEQDSPDLYDPEAALKYFLAAEEYFDRLDLDSRDIHCRLLFQVWAGIFEIASLHDNLKIVDDLATKIAVWEIAVPEAFSREDAQFLCGLKSEIAHLYAMDAYPRKAVRIIDEAMKLYFKYVVPMDNAGFADSFALKSYALKIWGTAEIGETQHALEMAEFFHNDSQQYFRSLVCEMKKGNEAVKNFINDYFLNYRKILFFEALCRLRLGDPKAAMKTLDEKVSLESWIDPQCLNIGLLPENIFRAECLLALNKYTKVQKLLDPTISCLENMPPMVLLLTDALYWRALLFFNKQKYESALDSINSAIAYLRIHMNRGKKQAVFSYTEFLILKIRICSAFSGAGDDLNALFEEAEKYWKLAIEDGRTYYKNLALDLREIAERLK